MHTKVAALLERLDGVREQGPDKWQARCPVHADTNPSLSIDVRGHRILLHCHGCQAPAEQIATELGLGSEDLFLDDTRSPSVSATVAALSESKGIPEDFLRELGLEDTPRGVGIPYLLEDSTPAPRQRLRTIMGPGGGPRWLGSTGRPVPYGLWRLDEARQEQYLVIVEGESDCWTLWYNEIPALGIPGASMVHLLTAEMVRDLSTIWVVQENDDAGAQFAANVPAKLRSLRFSGAVRVAKLPAEAKDPNELYCRNQETFRDTFIELLDNSPTATSALLEATPWQHLDDLMHEHFGEQLWLVKDFWTRESYGIVAGEPKTYKSVLTADLAVSVATGKPFLGSMEIGHQGPVLIVQNENHPRDVQDRFFKILQHKMGRDLRPIIRRSDNGRYTIQPTPSLQDIPIHLLSQEGFNLTDRDHMMRLMAKIEETEPVLLVLDPLYLMLGAASVSDERELRPVLQQLIQLSRTYQLAIVVVHHFSKGSAGVRGGQRLLGSTTLHGWLDSGAYLRYVDQEQRSQPEGSARTLNMERQLRVGVLPELELTFNLGRFGDNQYDVTAMTSADAEWRRLLHHMVRVEAVQNRDVRELLGCGRTKAVEIVTLLCSRGFAVMEGTGRSVRCRITELGIEESRNTSLSSIVDDPGEITIHR